MINSVLGNLCSWWRPGYRGWQFNPSHLQVKKYLGKTLEVVDNELTELVCFYRKQLHPKLVLCHSKDLIRLPITSLSVITSCVFSVSCFGFLVKVNNISCLTEASRHWSFSFQCILPFDFQSQGFRIPDMLNFCLVFWTFESWAGITFRNLSNLGPNFNSAQFYNWTYKSRCLPICVPAPTQEQATQSFQAWIHLSVLKRLLEM